MNFCDTTKLHSIQNKVNIPYNFSLKRSDQVVISMKSNSFKVNCTYLLKGEQQPECILCDWPLTLHHIFLECFDTLPAKHLLLNNWLCKIFFAHINISDILQILQECDFYNKIKIFTLLHFLLLKFSCASNDAREWAGALWWKIQHVQCLIWLCQHTCNTLNEFNYSFIHATSPYNVTQWFTAMLIDLIHFLLSV